MAFLRKSSSINPARAARAEDASAIIHEDAETIIAVTKKAIRSILIRNHPGFWIQLL